MLIKKLYDINLLVRILEMLNVMHISLTSGLSIIHTGSNY